MCGRAVQTQHAVQAAARALGVDTKEDTDVLQDNYNLSPGMELQVVCKNPDTRQLEQRSFKWGLIHKSGTAASPLPTNTMSLHFSNLMFNARSDTLLIKPTFSKLMHQQQTCIIPVDGYYEWKPHKIPKIKTKQPYYISSSSSSSLWMLGLWMRVPTGRPQDPFLYTVTILTTEANTELKDLHHRMPVLVSNPDWARQWILGDNLPRLLTEAIEPDLQTDCQDSKNQLHYHAVTTQLNSVQHRGGPESLEPIKSTTPSIKAFFGAKKSQSSSTGKRKETSQTTTPSKAAKIPKTGPMDAFLTKPNGCNSK